MSPDRSIRWPLALLLLAIVPFAAAGEPDDLPPLPPGYNDPAPTPAPPRDAGLRRVQARPADPTNPDESEMSIPRALSGASGGAPTARARTEAQEAPLAATQPGPAFLNRALGLQDTGVKLYGWIENSFTGNTDGRPPSGNNFGLFPNHRANQWMGNQYYLILENPIELNDTINLGYRVDTLFGNDWQETHSYGLFDNTFRNNSFVGLDFPQINGQLHLPILTTGGLDIKGGRWYSIAGYEQVMAAYRPLLSWPYMLTFTPFTFTGVLSTLHLTDRINVYNGTINGPDRWINQTYKWGYIGGLAWSSRDSKTTFAVTYVTAPNQFPRYLPADTQIAPTGMTPPPTLAGRRDPFYAGNFMNYVDAVVTHTWSDKLIQAFEAFTFNEQDVLGFGRGGTVANPGWYGLGNWFVYQFDPKLAGTWRSEIFRDNNGAATGVADTFYEMTLGFLYKPRDWLWVRPEARYDWAQFKKPFEDGTRGSRLTLGFDIMVLF